MSLQSGGRELSFEVLAGNLLATAAADLSLYSLPESTPEFRREEGEEIMGEISKAYPYLTLDNSSIQAETGGLTKEEYRIKLSQNYSRLVLQRVSRLLSFQQVQEHHRVPLNCADS
ncbi:hypothetical protein E2562_032362 [Oryza meyeriana var. granulata]|uniref:Uncharacterized protein n=1 Tax=Oryza meyeriana var. granulata TaxID=110450 RepID=A0A6G1E5A2_9ORYZ|nr:hypothetical protein E2562_032362 [Oryza meyeriana var. granulata]